MKTTSKIDLNATILYLFAIIRIAVGWHFLYEGVTKILTAGWSSAPYLAGSRWIFAPLFHSMAGSAGVVAVVDFLNIWGMILVGSGLILGLLTRWASIGGAVMLLFYFVAFPPIPGYLVGVPVEGSYLWVNKTLIEFFVLLVFIFISSDYHFSLDRLYSRWKEEKARKPVADLPSDMKKGLGRREAIRDIDLFPGYRSVCLCSLQEEKMGQF